MKIFSYTVRPNIPEPLKPLEEISQNLWLSWNFNAVNLFIRLDYEAWEKSHQNPAMMLGLVSQERLNEAALDDSFLAAISMVYERFKRYKSAETWYQGSRDNTIAYFSMEYGLDVSLPIFSGGLGILSGDHMKTSSDLGLPLTGVGLLYRQGYFVQYLNQDGYQQEMYPENDWYNMPVELCRDKDGIPRTVSVDIGDSQVVVHIWEVKVGRNSLYLLDANIDDNPEELRVITAALYGGDAEMRMKQEILLGIGGIRALRCLGINPAVVHMNEGHSAFLILERVRELVKDHGLTYGEAVQVLWPTNIFTTHTPVPAGNERFPVYLMEKYFMKCVTDLGLAWEDFLALGRENPGDQGEPFCMTLFAFRLSAYNNGVSRLHGKVSREMWKNIWPGLNLNEIPITHITNGVHPLSWISHDMVDLLDRYFGPRFYEEPTSLTLWNRMDRISDEELWRTHERRRERLVAFTRQNLKKQLEKRGSSEISIAHAEDVLSPYTLTISFARRFATYKRATLLLKDPDRLLKLVSDPQRPIQLIFAGKAHPHDKPGKELIREIVHTASRPEFRSKIVFLENYEMSISRHLLSGSDLWLNTPRRPLEASGTSGIKAAINGVLNVSILDGWWDEAWNSKIGWAIGAGEEYEDQNLQDEVESKALYDLLEREIVPAFYDRGRDNLPREWIGKMKECMRVIGQQFSSQRMLLEYSDKFYLPALKHYGVFTGENFRVGKDLAKYLDKVRGEWGSVKIQDMCCSDSPVHKVGDRLKVDAHVQLGRLSPEDVAVELVYGHIVSRDSFENPLRTEMAPIGKKGDSTAYSVEVICEQTGKQGYSVRVIPKHPHLIHPFLPGLIKWL
ncbi:MAG: glycosyltransferase family 1 protein [Spirochaetales bacterium]|nr:MAG: glycosyltransferase family 1 protein [Spirochaetales bacterium]